MTELQVFIALVISHLIAVVSPGPDFAIVVRHSIRHGFAPTVPMAIGIGTGILLHVFYSVMGIGIIIATNLIIFNLFKIAGAGYMLYMAYIGWCASSENIIPKIEQQKTSNDGDAPPLHHPSYTKWQAFRIGFLTNALNVKATIFFLSVYLLIAGNSPVALQIVYGIYLATATGLYFICLAFVLGGSLRERLDKYLVVIEKASSLLLATIAILLLLYNQPQLLLEGV